MNEEQYIMNGTSSVVDSDGRRLTCQLINKAYSVVPVLFILGLGYSTQVTKCLRLNPD
uniref:Ig-like domain-containing protein n=1 Tax=Mesocestoides corti TaxID=53468 RepID=A0A5K3FU47_MESCO